MTAKSDQQWFEVELTVAMAMFNEQAVDADRLLRKLDGQASWSRSLSDAVLLDCIISEFLTPTTNLNALAAAWSLCLIESCGFKAWSKRSRTPDSIDYISLRRTDPFICMFPCAWLEKACYEFHALEPVSRGWLWEVARANYCGIDAACLHPLLEIASNRNAAWSKKAVDVVRRLLDREPLIIFEIGPQALTWNFMDEERILEILNAFYIDRGGKQLGREVPGSR